MFEAAFTFSDRDNTTVCLYADYFQVQYLQIARPAVAIAGTSHDSNRGLCLCDCPAQSSSCFHVLQFRSLEMVPSLAFKWQADVAV